MDSMELGEGRQDRGQAAYSAFLAPHRPRSRGFRASSTNSKDNSASVPERGRGSYLLWGILSGVQVTGAWDTLSQEWVGHTLSHQVTKTMNVLFTTRDEQVGPGFTTGTQSQCKMTGQAEKHSPAAPPPLWEDALLREGSGSLVKVHSPPQRPKCNKPSRGALVLKDRVTETEKKTGSV